MAEITYQFDQLTKHEWDECCLCHETVLWATFKTGARRKLETVMGELDDAGRPPLKAHNCAGEPSDE